MIRPFSIILLLGALLVDAAPISLQPRQDVSIQALDEPLTAPRTFQTVSQTQTNAGMVTLTCQITQTPIQDPSGQQQNLVREEKSCMITVQGGSGGGQAPIDQPSGTQTSTVTPTAGGGDGGNGGGQQTTAPQASGTTNTIPPTTSPTTSLMTGTMVGSGVATGPISTDSGTPTTSAAASGGTSASPNPTSSASAGGNNGNNNANGGNNGNNGNNNGGGGATPQPDVSAIGASSVPAGALPSQPSNGVPVNGTAAAAESSATPAPFELPGRQIAVLPIGLGVFAGISVIALIVVGLVTYERTKYRKAFRQRKLAESGAGMGYGGMAERA